MKADLFLDFRTAGVVSDPGPPRCIAAGVRRLERAQARSSNSRLTPHPSSLILHHTAPRAVMGQIASTWPPRTQMYWS